MLEREKIEYEISEYNKKYYKKAINSIFYQDKIYNRLNIDKTRDKILQGIIER